MTDPKPRSTAEVVMGAIEDLHAREQIVTRGTLGGFTSGTKGGFHAGRDGDDREERRIECRVFGARHRIEGVEAERREHQRHDQRELPVADGEAGDVHVAYSALAVAMETFSPSVR